MDPSAVREAINSKFNSLFTLSDVNGNNVMKPNVCGVCDEFIKLRDICILSFKELKECCSLLGKRDGIFYHEGCRDYYFQTGEQIDDTVPWERIFLSPGTQVRSLHNNHEEQGILTCKNCNDALRKRVLPKMAISNGFFFGSPPDCLLCLTEVERAFLTPIKTYGFCFSYTGGFQKELKGSLSYYKVKMSSIARTAAHFVTLGLADNIVVLLYGRMTTEQKRKALTKNKMRTGHLLTAISWLCTYNSEWKNQNIDVAAIANSAIDICTGGQDTVEDFKLLMQEAKGHGYDFELQADLLRESVTDYKDNNLVNACLIQFPYGTGGVNEERYLSEKKIGFMDIESYVSHVSRISRPHFHEELFVLILYNMKMKIKMVRGASWRVRHMSTASLLATELNEEDIDIAVKNRRAGMLSSGTGEQFLKAIDAIGRGVAHTNEAAKKARRTAECLQHNFGMPTHFLTVTPDDDNSILVQSYSQKDIDINSKAVDDMDVAEIENLGRKRKELRIKVPGIAAMVFEDILDIIIESVIGWDRKSCTGRLGLFGVPLAFTCTVEEQGRKTLHTHIQIWTKEIYEERSKLFSSNREQSRNANQTLCKEAERTMGTSFFFNGYTHRHHAASFPHECTLPARSRKLPMPVPDQMLRELRYKQGNAITGTMFATCPHCPKSWKYEELVKDYIFYNVKDKGFVVCEGEGDLMLRMKAKTLEYQKTKEQQNIPSYIIEAGYNLHLHTNSCFKTTGTYHCATSPEAKKMARKRSLQCECRYRLPVRKKKKTVIIDAYDGAVKWYDWTGKHVERNIKELQLKRGRFDLFQNQSCPAIGESKLSCNTNISMVFHGSTGQYAFKYCTKSTQQDDRAEFDRVMEQKDKIISKIPHANGERTEATRRLLLASFAHQRSNVIGAPLSSFLTRNDERFIFSHPTVWIPMKDLKSLVNDNHVSSSAIIYHGKTPFFLCSALHYLTRPVELEDICAFDFYSEYEVIRVTRKTVDSLLQFKNSDFFTHPSYKQSCDCFLQGVRKRHQMHLPKVFQFDFPDTASFNNDIIETNQISEEMEEYAQMICILFVPFRSKEDLLLDGSYVLKVRQSINLLTETKQSFLNNIQDAKSNCFRIMNLKDDLQRVTVPMKHDDEEHFQNWRDDEQEEDIEEMQGEALDNFLEELNRNLEGNDIGPGARIIPTSLHLKKLKDKGRKECGYKGLCHLDIPINVSDCTFLNSSIEDPEQGFPDIQNANSTLDTSVKDTIFKCDIVKIIMQRTNRITRSFKEISGRSDDVEVLEANGSVKSIFDWATKAGLDQHQRRAFEIILGHFLLTFVQEAITSPRDALQDRRVFNTQKAQLYKLLEKDRRSSPQTICLLYGPGGCGKTTVIDLTLEYAREYCSFFDTIEFNSRTIVVTALTGVAATIIRGETTHAAVYLNQTKELQPEQIELWNNTRLLIVDEVSFASKEVFIELDRKLRKLKSRADCAYGGLNIIFSGDFRQLEPVGYSQQPIYKEPCPQFNDWINCFIELQGMHRFKDDPEWGFLLRRFRDGLATIQDINIINSRVVTENDALPQNIRYATYFNRDRDAINAALFEQRCMDMQSGGLPLHDSILILSDNHFVQNGSRVYTTFQNPKKIWEECGEDDIKVTKCSHRMDPVLRLYSGCRVMLPNNEDVKNGIANGTQANVVCVNILQGVIPFDVMINDTCKVQAVFASQVESVELEHVNARITPRIFKVTPKQHTFKVKISKPQMFQTKRDQTEELHMKAIQVPILVNNATTGHKLQGCGVPIIFVHGWSNVRNWAYVILSRVRTLSGLYLREKLDTDLSNYAVPDELQSLLQKFRHALSPAMWTDEQYDELFGYH